MDIPICKETVAMAKECLLSGKSFKPFDKLFIPSETTTAKHELYEQFVADTGCLIPKIFIYIVMDDLFGVAQDKDEDGNFGYKLKLISPPKDTITSKDLDIADRK